MDTEILKKISFLCKCKAEMNGETCIGLSFHDASWPLESSLRNHPKKHDIVKLALEMKSLKILNLRKARLGFVPDANMSSLVDVDLSCNSLEYLPEFCFGKNIRILNAGSNFIKDIKTAPQKIEVLKIHKNNIGNLPSLPKSLRFLNLYLNPQKTIPRLNLPNLEFFSFGGTECHRLPDFPKKLKWLSLVANQINYLPPQICSLQEMQGIRLAKNNLENLPKNIGEMQNLKELTLYKNKLKDLPDSFFELKLNKLNILENRLPKKLKKKILNHFKKCSFLRV